jgi:hypothetical protein
VIEPLGDADPPARFPDNFGNWAHTEIEHLTSVAYLMHSTDNGSGPVPALVADTGRDLRFTVERVTRIELA